MVLQRDKPLPIWGWAEPGESVSVEFAGQRKSGVAEGNGGWRVVLDPLSASLNPEDLKVSGGNTIVLRNVVVGEVWLCAGQSNMRVTVRPWGGAITAGTRRGHSRLAAKHPS